MWPSLLVILGWSAILVLHSLSWLNLLHFLDVGVTPALTFLAGRNVDDDVRVGTL